MKSLTHELNNKKIVRVNIGSGIRWIKKRWPVYRWKNLAEILHKNGYKILLFAGTSENKLEQEWLNLLTGKKAPQN
ncbi:glycosyltransferase family 9 protein [bacterium]